MRTHLIHRPARDILPLLGGFRVSSYRIDLMCPSCCCGFPAPAELGAVNPDAVQDHGQPARQGHDRLFHPAAPASLSLNPDKTRLIEFGRFAAERRARRGLGKPETFNFLGFTFICERNSRGQFLIKRTTRRDRMRATLRRIREELRRRMHEPIPEQGAWLKRMVRGFFAYHAVPTNGSALRAFYYYV